MPKQNLSVMLLAVLTLGLSAGMVAAQTEARPLRERLFGPNPPQMFRQGEPVVETGRARAPVVPPGIAKPDATSTAPRAFPPFAPALKLPREVATGTLGGQPGRDRARQHAEQMLVRLETAVGRQEILLDRVRSRLAKMAAESPVSEEVRSLVAEATQAVTEARDAVTALRGNLGAALADEAPGEALAALKPALSETVAQIKATHQSIVEIITALKAAN
jgi:hypothetical protein